MADSTASSTLDAPRPATTKRRARAASSDTDNRPARAALLVEAEAGQVHRTGRGKGVAGDRPVDLFPADDALAAAYTMNPDPRQGTLDGFELPADALASQTERAAPDVSGPAVRDPAPPAPAPALPEPARAVGDTGAPPTNTPDDNAPNFAPPRRQTPARQPAARAASVGRMADAPSRDALVQTVAELQAALADERRAARESRRHTTRLVSIAIVTLLLMLVLGVAQIVVAMRASRESAAAQDRTEALLRAEQTELAAFTDAASAASADIRGAAAALNAKLAAPPARTAAAQTSVVKKRAPRSAHPHRTNEKARGAPGSV